MSTQHDIVTRLRGLPTAAISDALDQAGIEGAVQGLAPLSDGFRAAGPAFTVLYVPVDDHAGGTVGDFLDIRTTTGLAAWLLEEAQVAVVPGEAFDAPGRLRLCFAVDDPTLETALTRLTAALHALASDSARPLVTTGRR